MTAAKHAGWGVCLSPGRQYKVRWEWCGDALGWCAYDKNGEFVTGAWYHKKDVIDALHRWEDA